MLFALARTFGQHDLDLFAFASVEDQVFDLLRKFGERDVETKPVVLSEAVQPATAPRILVVVKSFFDDRTIAECAGGVRDEQGREDAFGGAQAGAGAARARWVVEGEIAVVQRR